MRFNVLAESIISDMLSEGRMSKVSKYSSIGVDTEKMLEKLPIATYPGIRSVVVPEFNMPGGRSRFFRYIWNIGTGG